MNIFTLITELASLLAKYGPELTAAEQALASGGIAGLIAYLETLVSPAVPPPAPLPADVRSKISSLASQFRSRKAAVCPTP